MVGKLTDMFQPLGLWHARYLWTMDRTELCCHKYLHSSKQIHSLSIQNMQKSLVLLTERAFSVVYLVQSH